MTDNEILSQILHELKEINNTIQDLYSGTEAQNEMMMNKLSSFETIAERMNSALSAIEDNTHP
ncbi:MAG: hypothetical protein P4L45_03820 [Ignavibacteriaceae bacterium]|jgi:hypothetical protein|nr:hypothetical protein [Ignavibacteriaceae bacterium]